MAIDPDPLLDLYAAAQAGIPYDQRPRLIPIEAASYAALARAAPCSDRTVLLGGEVHSLRKVSTGALVLALDMPGGPIDPDLTAP